MARIGWVFTDPTTLEEHTWEVNPNDGGSPDISKSLSQKANVAPDGGTVIYQGAPPVQTLEFSGVILDQDHYDVLSDWAARSHLIQITDDLDRTFVVIVDKFSPKRVRKGTRPYYHTYSMSCTIVR